MIKYKHIRIINSATLPLTLFCFKELEKPHPIS